MSVPHDKQISVTMTADTWAFGMVQGRPVASDVADRKTGEGGKR